MKSKQWVIARKGTNAVWSICYVDQVRDIAALTMLLNRMLKEQEIEQKAVPAMIKAAYEHTGGFTVGDWVAEMHDCDGTYCANCNLVGSGRRTFIAKKVDNTVQVEEPLLLAGGDTAEPAPGQTQRAGAEPVPVSDRVVAEQRGSQVVDAPATAQAAVHPEQPAQTTTLATTHPTQVMAGDVDHVEYVPFGSDRRIQLRLEFIRDVLAAPTRDGRKPDVRECRQILMRCAAMRLDPAAGDVWVLPFEDARGGRTSWQIVVSYLLFYKRAQMDPDFRGVESGIIIDPPLDCRACNGTGILVEHDGRRCPVCNGTGQRDELPSTFLPPSLEKDHKIVGAWARVKFGSGKEFYRRLPIQAYAKSNSVWQRDPGGMLCKCAEVAVLRRAYPNALEHVYIPEEVPDEPTANIEPAQIKTETPFAALLK